MFTLILFPAVSTLIGSIDAGQVAATGGAIVSAKLLAWGIGGIVFGVLADHIGRARTMLITVLIYAVFTGLSALAQTWWQLAILRALAGLGMGSSRPPVPRWSSKAGRSAAGRAMQAMQLCCSLGFFAAATLNLFIGPYDWRWMFAAGVAPAPIILGLRVFVQEPERWLAVRANALAPPGRRRPFDILRGIFAPDRRRVTIVALTMLFVSNSLTPLVPIRVHQLLRPSQQASAGKIISQFFMLLSIGGLVGYVALIWPIERLPRRWSYVLIVLGSAAVIAWRFTGRTTIEGLLWFAPPLRLLRNRRFWILCGLSSGVVFNPGARDRLGVCWNFARGVASISPSVAGTLVGAFGSVPAASRAIAFVYVIGLITIWFGPELRASRSAIEIDSIHRLA